MHADRHHHQGMLASFILECLHYKWSVCTTSGGTSLPSLIRVSRRQPKSTRWLSRMQYDLYTQYCTCSVMFRGSGEGERACNTVWFSNFWSTMQPCC